MATAWTPCWRRPAVDPCPGLIQDSFNWTSSIMDKIFQDRLFTREPQDTSTTHPSAHSRRGLSSSIPSSTGHGIPYHFPVEFTEDNQNHTVCKEIHHNSTGCLRMKDQCDMPGDLVSGLFGQQPLSGPAVTGA
ncbi:hypothetical protein GH733_006574 [Mirounga leonina]|nr:hypothetical protein GH733_006574 [Mirounga leonina]